MFLTLFFYISLAFADPKAVTLKTGDVAPFSGTLLNQEAVSKILVDADAKEKECEIKLDLAVEIQRAKFEQQIGLISSKNEICEKKMIEINEDYKKLSSKYNNLSKGTPVIAGISFLGGIALTILIVNSI
jgi:hypothetical protein